MASNSRNSSAGEPRDLQTQLEEILNAVWAAEAEWRLDDRIEISLRNMPKRPKADAAGAPDGQG
ncbi:MAG TPA: hypothetical protein VIA06_08830 [Candidatus Dormibacteraeota bacterium]|jgi:hypothetical protein|nr:hypothetical protein [Candidatus Dormibacteraeota bacterium]